MTNVQEVTDFRVRPLEDIQKIIFAFRTAETLPPVQMNVALATKLLATLAHCLATNPDERARRDPIQMLSVKDISAGLWNGVPTLSYELALGARVTTTIETQDAIRLRDQLNAMIEECSSVATARH